MALEDLENSGNCFFSYFVATLLDNSEKIVQLNKSWW